MIIRAQGAKNGQKLVLPAAVPVTVLVPNASKRHLPGASKILAIQGLAPDPRADLPRRRNTVRPTNESTAAVPHPSLPRITAAARNRTRTNTPKNLTTTDLVRGHPSAITTHLTRCTRSHTSLAKKRSKTLTTPEIRSGGEACL